MTKIHLTAQQGLTARQAQERLDQFGANQLVAAKKPALWRQVVRHLSDVSSLVLLFAVGLASYMALFQGGGWTKTIVIGSILVINVIIGLYQEASAEKALAALQSMSLPTTTVRRDDIAQTLPAKDVVPGDLVLLKAGDQVPADGVVLQSTNLTVDEAVLTGESVPVAKEKLTDPTAAAETQQVFSGTAVTGGTAIIQVVTTGMATELGQIAGLLNKTKKRATPLQGRLNRLSGWLTAFAVLGGLVIFALSIWMQNQGLADSLMIGISLAVAAVPETLPIIVTISLAHGVKRMAKRNAIMRRVNAVETIGGVDVIASDKTGTLTQNQMTITRYWTPNTQNALAAEDLSPAGEQLMRYLGLATNAEIQLVDGQEETMGDPTELAIVRWLKQHDRSRQAFEKQAPRLAEDPFDSTKKTMATIHRLSDGQQLVIVKGAFDRLPIAWETGQLAQAQAMHDSFGQQALRVLSVGYRVMPATQTHDWAELTQGLKFAGLVGIIDPPRPEVIPAIREAKRAGIKPVMITGDHMVTAEAIAKEIGLLTPGQLVMSGDELRTLTDAQLDDQIADIAVYARVSPTDKIRIVQAWQRAGKTVAMTGDGVNDAPALKAADVGIAMGITGTEVSKGAADMVLTDDNFATIIAAVREGRTVYQNILKAVEFLVGVNFAQIFLMVGAVLMGWGAPLLAEQLLLINVLADGIPGFYISREPGEKEAMAQPPVANDESLFARGLGGRLAVRAVTFTVLTLGIYALGRFGLSNGQATLGMTMVFLVLAVGSMIDIYAIKDRQPLTRQSLRRNPTLNVSMLLAIALVLAIATVPGLQGMFGLVSLPAVAWLIVIPAMFLPTLVLEIAKRWQRRDTQNWLVETD
ncbi:MAG: cation-translocating P-type ATPase [Levilactobacillus sp.]|nr:cation-translocating P-type ATPase [Levilactobacillus sp.]MCH4123906.1 cation-translocating P-type ATPase [Levilactobacillus sp.]MCI1554004.1 cation-translocating P-type ATPase [Levilactobacillus sp.]MCI1606114.1 cation-translocating P-type ATPase [Levilactobacillus sp.]